MREARAGIVDEEIRIAPCLRCQGRRVIPGRVVGWDAVMTPAGFRWGVPQSFWRMMATFMTAMRSRIIPLETDAYLCLDSGTVWTSVDRDEAVRNVNRFASEATKAELGLAAKTPVPVDDLA